MMAWELPDSLEVNGNIYPIRTDFRDIINICVALSDPDLDDDSRTAVFFGILFKTPVRAEDLKDAYEQGMKFISAGIEDDGRPAPTLMDWEKDASLIIPAVNKVAGAEVRAQKMHWWTFVGYYMEIGESTFANVINIRTKKSKGKKLEDYEQEFYRENRGLIDLKPKLTEEEQAEKDALMKLLG